MRSPRPLDALLAALPEYVLVPEGIAVGVAVTAVEHDSRIAGPGSLYCALKGEHTDGHRHAATAVAAGAVAVVVEHPVAVSVPQIVVPDTRAAMGRLADAFFDHPSRRIAVVGVTGTNGKTTVTHLLAAVLNHVGRTTRVVGTLSGARTTPEAPALQSALAEAADAGASVVAMEVSSHAIELRRIVGTWFTVAVFTNLSQDHLDFHGTMDRYFAAKTRLFEPERAAVGLVNRDDPWGARLLEAIAIPAVAWSAEDAEDPELRADGSRFTWRGHRIELALAGRFNLANAVAAAEAALALGLEPAQIAAGLAQAGPVRGRFEPVGHSDVAVLVDYAHTPDGLVQALASARELTEGRLIVVFGCGGDRDRDKRPLMGRAADQGADVVIVTSDNPRQEDPAAIVETVMTGVERVDDLIVEPDRRRAVDAAVALAAPGDLVLVAGKGHETTQDLGDRVIDFDDREVAAAALARRGHGEACA
ncbi:MAG TPA: UDP-N-acetylmuramoyl-L-alanyl-D-glutamate--2,6-diaminopimelate ligase [Acidimicrobiales bacterium]|nr:UDP-N-acetylmuramoyl-L-alanyl-D-glutamate--2,6-diaminopimelate ligase [Acidimicrobiales bacterium]